MYGNKFCVVNCFLAKTYAIDWRAVGGDKLEWKILTFICELIHWDSLSYEYSRSIKFKSLRKRPQMMPLNIRFFLPAYLFFARDRFYTFIVSTRLKISYTFINILSLIHYVSMFSAVSCLWVFWHYKPLLQYFSLHIAGK